MDAVRLRSLLHRESVYHAVEATIGEGIRLFRLILRHYYRVHWVTSSGLNLSSPTRYGIQLWYTTMVCGRVYNDNS